MKTFRFIFVFLASAFFMLPSHAQDTTKLRSQAIISAHIHYGFQFPGADMKPRYGINQNVGAGISYKTPSNWMFEADFSYIFSGNVKIHDSIFAGIADDEGNIIDGNGQYAEVYTYERGYYIMAGIGKVLPLLAVNNNSGVYFSVGAGFMQHKIRIYNPEKTAPQVCDDYAKGYDYLSNGFAIRQFLGYTFFAPKKVYSFKAGFECVEAFTQCRRDYLFPLHGPDTEKRLDILYGFKLIWTIPFKKSTGDVYYFY